ncbi:apolipoprotein C-III [Dryobates pubescens]|uniref:apolipoprotein C-III n=1 Tax=Dryobates pubescens TaxID=118200 RepID=UPI0023B9B60F|nr:apolipoprotein C-III [Dryobates pubescens]
MKGSILLLFVCVAALAAAARADTGEQPKELVRKVQEYTQKATAMVKHAFTTLQESEVAQQARRWLSDNAELAKQQLAWMKQQLAELWKRTPAA